MSVLEWALSAAGRGWAVLPIWGRDANNNCLCPLGVDCGKNVGKHPDTRPGMAPRGSVDASNDVDKIRHWFADNPTHNYGILCGERSSGLMVQDVDDPAVAQRILDAGAATVKTGKGCHIYFHTPNPGRTAHVFKTGQTGKANDLGELRGNGAYVVGPGSSTVDGRTYELQYVNNDWPTLVTVPDPYAHGKHLFDTFGGVSVDKPAPSERYIEYIGRVIPQDIPFDTSDTDCTTLVELFEGIFVTRDRSGYLHHLLNELVRVAQKKGVVLTLEQMAGIAKRADLNLRDKSPAGPKYAGRRNADAEYAREAGSVLKGAHTTDKVAPQQPSFPYAYDPQNGLRYLGRTGDVPVANFLAKLSQEVTVSGGIHDRRFVLACSIPGQEEQEIVLTPHDLSSGNNLQKAIYTQLPARYIVKAEGWSRFFEAAKHMSAGSFMERMQYGEAGWTEAGQYVLPRMDGAISSDGLDESIEFEDPESAQLSQRLYLYGVGVRGVVTSEDYELAERALAALLASAKPEVLLPILTQVLGGPLARWLAPKYVLHVHGRSGLMKTALCCTTLSLFGHFIGTKNESLVPETWLSTYAALSAVLHIMQDVCVMIDDYKESTIRSKRDLSTLLQSYADGTVRGRMNVDQTLRKALVPRALILSTGEDIWEDQESTRARTMLVGINEGDIDSAQLRIAERYADSGGLAVVGGMYLQWLAQKGASELLSTIERYRQAFDTEVRPRMEGAHNRMIENTATMLAVSALVRDFIGEQVPGLAQHFQQLQQASIEPIMASAIAASKSAAALSPFDKLQDWLLAGMHAKTLQLRPTKSYGSTKIMGGGSGDIIGYYDSSKVYLNEAMTMSVYRTWLARQREEPTFGWTQLNGEIAKRKGTVSQILRLDKGQLRFSTVPLTVMFPEGIEELEEDPMAVPWMPS